MSPRPSILARKLEREASYDRAGALTGSSCLRNNGAEAAAIQALVGARSIQRGSRARVPAVNVNRGSLPEQANRSAIRPNHAVENIGEFRAKLQSVALLNPEVAAEVRVLRRNAWPAEASNGSLIRGE